MVVSFNCRPDCTRRCLCVQSTQALESRQPTLGCTELRQSDGHRREQQGRVLRGADFVATAKCLSEPEPGPSHPAHLAQVPVQLRVATPLPSDEAPGGLLGRRQLWRDRHESDFRVKVLAAVLCAHSVSGTLQKAF